MSDPRRAMSVVSPRVVREEANRWCGAGTGEDHTVGRQTGYQPLTASDPLHEAWPQLRALSEVGMLATNSVEHNKHLIGKVWAEVESLRAKEARIRALLDEEEGQTWADPRLTPHFLRKLRVALDGEAGWRRE